MPYDEWEAYYELFPAASPADRLAARRRTGSGTCRRSGTPGPAPARRRGGAALSSSRCWSSSPSSAPGLPRPRRRRHGRRLDPARLSGPRRLVRPDRPEAADLRGPRARPWSSPSRRRATSRAPTTSRPSARSRARRPSSRSCPRAPRSSRTSSSASSTTPPCSDNAGQPADRHRAGQGRLRERQKTLEVAEINVKEYIEGIYPQEMKTIQGEIKLAESELARAQDRLEWSDECSSWATSAEAAEPRRQVRPAEVRVQPRAGQEEARGPREVHQREADQDASRATSRRPAPTSSPSSRPSSWRRRRRRSSGG